MRSLKGFLTTASVLGVLAATSAHADTGLGSGPIDYESVSHSQREELNQAYSELARTKKARNIFVIPAVLVGVLGGYFLGRRSKD